MENLEAVWAAAREELSSQLTSISYQKWIEVLLPVTVQNTVLIIECPDDVTRSTIRQFYNDLLRDSVKKYADGGIRDILLILPEQRRDFVHDEETETASSAVLNPKYTFETFVVGSSNKFAAAACRAVADNPGKAYNPLFLYGGVGLGKTHLMNAIGHQIRKNKPTARVLYITSENFTNELIEALRKGRNVEFRQRFRNLDALMIDDVQFIANKQSVQEEFFNTFNTLHNAGKQIVISSDRPPKEISTLEERLRSRFEWGLIADIQEPDLETRIAILRNKAQEEHIDISDDIIEFIAENTTSNIRSLEGNLTRVLFYASINGRPVSMDLVREALQDILPLKEKKKITPDVIKEAVCSYYSLPVQSLVSQRRDKEVVLPRQVAMYLCHSLLSLPYKRIAYLFDRNDHTTAISACTKIEKLMDDDASFREEIDNIKERLL